MTRELPGIPRRHPSKPDREPQAPDVYEILHEHDKRLGGLEGLAQEGKLADAKIIDKLENIEATGTHQLVKQIIALATTAVVTVGGILGGQQLTKPSIPVTTPPPARSALDVKLDLCRPMAPGPGREECFARVTAETDH